MESTIQDLAARNDYDIYALYGYTHAAIFELQIIIRDDETSRDALIIAWAKYSHKKGSSHDLKSQKFQVESSFENEKS